MKRCMILTHTVSNVMMAADTREFTDMVYWTLPKPLIQLIHSSLLKKIQKLLGITGAVLRGFSSYLI